MIRVHEGEATRISFVLRKPVRDLFVEIWQYLDSREGHAGGWHFPTWKNPQPGYQDTFWDGMRSRPPETGTYRVCITVHGGDGHTERVFDQIRVENPNKRTVRPRNDAKRYLASLRLDGKTAVLSDTDGYAITMRAVSQDPPDDHQRDRTNYHTAEPARLHLPRPEPSPRCGTPQVRHDLATKRLQRADVDL